MEGKPATSKAPRPPPTHPSTLKMVTDAIEALKEPKGVPAVRIKLYICEKYKDINPNALKHRLRQALEKGIENGLIAKSKTTEEKSALMSRYKLLKQKPEKKVKSTEAKTTKPKTKTSEEKTKKKVTPKKPKAKTDAVKKKPAKSPKKTKSTEKTAKPKKPKTTPVKKTAKAKPKVAKLPKAPKTPKTPKQTKSKK